MNRGGEEWEETEWGGGGGGVEWDEGRMEEQMEEDGEKGKKGRQRRRRRRTMGVSRFDGLQWEASDEAQPRHSTERGRRGSGSRRGWAAATRAVGNQFTRATRGGSDRGEGGGKGRGGRGGRRRQRQRISEQQEGKRATYGRRKRIPARGERGAAGSQGGEGDTRRRVQSRAAEGPLLSQHRRDAFPLGAAAAAASRAVRLPSPGPTCPTRPCGRCSASLGLGTGRPTPSNRRPLPVCPAAHAPNTLSAQAIRAAAFDCSGARQHDGPPTPVAPRRQAVDTPAGWAGLGTSWGTSSPSCGQTTSDAAESDSGACPPMSESGLVPAKIRRPLRTPCDLFVVSSSVGSNDF